MKKIIPLACILLLTGSATNAQMTYSGNFSGQKALPEPDIHFKNGKAHDIPEKGYEYYKQLSKKQRTVGWATLIGGVVLSGIGLAIADADYASGNDQYEAAGIITIAGAASGIVSIPFMILASVNKRKARMMLSTQKTGFGIPVKPGNITGISVFIPIGK